MPAILGIVSRGLNAIWLLFFQPFENGGVFKLLLGNCRHSATLFPNQTETKGQSSLNFGVLVCLQNPETAPHISHYIFKKCCPPYVSWRNIRFCHTTDGGYRATYTMSPFFVVVKRIQWSRGGTCTKSKLCRGFLNNPVNRFFKGGKKGKTKEEK